MTAADKHPTIDLTHTELREVVAYAIACAEPTLAIFERDCPNDPRPRAVLDEVRKFAAGGNRTKAIRTTAFDAHRAARTAADQNLEAAANAARAAAHAGGAAYLHPLATATQAGHILMSAAHTARALELDADDDHTIGTEYLRKATNLAGPTVLRVLARYPLPPGGRGRVGELWRELDTLLRVPNE